MQSGNWHFSFCAPLLLLAACGGSEGGPQSAVSRSTESAVLAQPEIGDLAALADKIVARSAELPRREFEPLALSKALGSEPQAHLDWVRNQTGWVPYRGLLRGSRGVMLDRVGSNLDRAVLLGDLLRLSGHTVRLAHAELGENQARELLVKASEAPDRRAPAFKPTESGERERAREATGLARVQAESLFRAVGKPAVGAERREDALALAAIRDYWWVEREENGDWIAMHVPPAGLQDDIEPVRPEITAAWNSMDDFPAVPDGVWHVVDIRVVVERFEDSVTSEAAALEVTLKPAKVLWLPITLAFAPKQWTDTATDRDAFREAAFNVREWQPYLKVGDEVVAQSAFTESGDLTSFNDGVGGLLGGGGTVAGFGDALGGGSDAGSAHATAVWIAYTTKVPGQPDRTTRRPVFDILGPARRLGGSRDFVPDAQELVLERAEALLGFTDILLQPCEFTKEFVTDILLSGVVANSSSVTVLTKESDPERAAKLASEILERIAIWGPLPELALWRSALNWQPGDWFIDRPNILNYRVNAPVVDGNRVSLMELLDVADNPVGVRWRPNADAFRVRLNQGVVDTVAEMVTFGSDLEDAENTASVFHGAGAGNEFGSRVGEKSAVGKLGWPSDPAARLASHIDDGFVAIVPNQPVERAGRPRVGWWRVDPRTGDTIGVMDTGFHTDVETGETTEIVALRSYIQREGPRNRALRSRVNNNMSVSKGDREFMNEFMGKLKRLQELERPTRGPRPPP